MPILSGDSLHFSGIVWTLKLLTNTRKQACGMLGYLHVAYRDQHVGL